MLEKNTLEDDIRISRSTINSLNSLSLLTPMALAESGNLSLPTTLITYQVSQMANEGLSQPYVEKIRVSKDKIKKIEKQISIVAKTQQIPIVEKILCPSSCFFFPEFVSLNFFVSFLLSMCSQFF